MSCKFSSKTTFYITLKRLLMYKECLPNLRHLFSATDALIHSFNSKLWKTQQGNLPSLANWSPAAIILIWVLTSRLLTPNSSRRIPEAEFFNEQLQIIESMRTNLCISSINWQMIFISPACQFASFMKGPS